MRSMEIAGKMLNTKDNINSLIQSIKGIEQDFDQVLQNSATRATVMIGFSKSLSEIRLTSKMTQEYLKKGDDRRLEALLVELSRQISSLQGQIAEDLQKSMLQCIEILAQIENILMLMSYVNRLRWGMDDIFTD